MLNSINYYNLISESKFYGIVKKAANYGLAIAIGTFIAETIIRFI